MHWFDRLIVASLPVIPRGIVKQVAERYVAGETMSDAIETARILNQQGALVTMDILGEEVTSEARTRQTVDDYVATLDNMAQAGIDGNISVKLTAFGLRLDRTLCLDNVAQVVEHAAALGSFVRIDMEDHACTDVTLDIYRKLRQQYRNVGVVLQSMLHRTEKDAAQLLDGQTNVRLCKGIYREPAEIAYQDPDEVRDSYRRTLELLLQRGAYVGIATHDDALTDWAVETVAQLGLARDQYEFQMLLGVRENLRQDLISRGHRLRVYVPYGADWYAYSVRRLRENPSVAKHVMTAFINGE